jgi:hypothetical protein
MYVISVHGLDNNPSMEAGTDKRSRSFPEITSFLSRNPMTATIVIIRKTMTLR